MREFYVKVELLIGAFNSTVLYWGPRGPYYYSSEVVQFPAEIHILFGYCASFKLMWAPRQL